MSKIKQEKLSMLSEKLGDLFYEIDDIRVGISRHLETLNEKAKQLYELALELENLQSEEE